MAVAQELGDRNQIAIAQEHLGQVAMAQGTCHAPGALRGLYGGGPEDRAKTVRERAENTYGL